MNVAIIADDLTGAADSGIQFVLAGYRTAVAFRGAPIPPMEDLGVVVVDTDSRLLSDLEARDRVEEAGLALKDAWMVYKKIDSTLRGPIPAELAAAREATGRSKAVVAPAFPSTGRQTIDGVQLVNGEPVQETGLAQDPHTPVEEGHIPTMLARAGFENVSTLGARDLDSVGQVLDDSGWVVVDAKEDKQLEALVRAVPKPDEVLWVGSGGLARALSKVYPGSNPSATSGEKLRTVGRVLLVVGSTNEVVREQLKHVAGEAEVAAVPIDSRAVAGGDPEEAIHVALDRARKSLGETRDTVLYTTLEERLESKEARLLVDAIAEVVNGLSEENLFDALVLTGGDTAVHVARSLGAGGILLEEEIEAGVPVGTLIGPKPYRVVTKAGGFGNPDTLVNVLRKLTGRNQP